MNDNENLSVNNTEQPVTTVEEPLQDAAPVEEVTPTEPSIPETPVVETTASVDNITPVVEATIASEVTAEPAAPTITSVGDAIAQPITPSTETTVAQPTEATATKKKSKLPIIIIAAIGVIAIGVLVYFLFFKKVTGKQVVNGTINKIFATAETISEAIDDAFIIDYKKDIITSSGYLKASIESDDPQVKAAIGDIQSLSIKYDMQINAKDLEGYINLSSNENDKEIINLTGLLKDKIFYMNSNVFDTVYKYDMTSEVDWNEIKEYVNKLPEYNSRAVSTVVKKTKEYLKNAIKEEYITTDEGTYTVDGVEIKGTKTTLTITQKTANEIVRSMMAQAKDDSELITLVSKTTTIPEEQIKEMLNQYITALDKAHENGLDTESKFYVIVYTTSKGKFLGLEVKVQDQAIATAISKNDITTIKLKLKQEIKLTYDEKKKELSWVNEAEGNNGEKVVITFKDGGIKIEFIMNGIKLTLEDDYKNSKTKLEDKLTASAEYTQEGKTTKGTVELSCSLEKANEIKTFDTSNAKNVKEMTEYEQQEISNKVRQAIENTAIGKVLMSTSKATLNHKVYMYDDYTGYNNTLDTYNYNYSYNLDDYDLDF